MTLIEVQNQIFTHFLKTDTFTFPDDLKKIKVSKTQESFKKELVVSVLDKLSEDGICDPIIINTEFGPEPKAYVMVSPLGENGQEVVISNKTAELIAEIVNQYIASKGQTEGVVNKLDIHEQDIQNLAIITAQALNSLDDEPPSEFGQKE